MQKNYLDSLTWLRAFAAFVVVVTHSVRATNAVYATQDEASHFLPANLLDIGSFGVYLFFALSGCTLYLSNQANLHSITRISDFYVKRFFRIWPAFAFSLIVYLGFIEIFRAFYTAGSTLWIGQFLNEYSLLNIAQYLTLTFNLTGPADLFQGPYWSLPVEFQYYLLLPFAILLIRNNLISLLVPVVFGGVLYLLYRGNWIPLDSNQIFKMGFSFFGGVLIAQLYQLKKILIPSKLALAIFATLVLFVGLVRNDIISIPSQLPLISDKWNFYGICAILCVFLAINMEPITVKNKFTKLLHRYGEISYSIYLFHMLFVGIAVLLIINIPVYGNYQKLALTLVISIFGSYGFSLLTYKYIEQPSIHLGRRLGNRYKKKQTQDAATEASIAG